MRVGFVGLGKLGYPVATAMAFAGHRVVGYDVDATKMTYEPRPYRETGPDGTGDLNDWITRLAESDGEAGDAVASGSLTFGDLDAVCDGARVVFVAAQTPHYDPRFAGEAPLPDERRDFDYTYLVNACEDLARYLRPGAVVAVISTVLPGTLRRAVLPLFPMNPVVYNPFFIAMGTTWRDYAHPEFVLLGADEERGEAVEVVSAVHREVEFSLTEFEDLADNPLQREAPRKVVSIESAELAKVAYNTFISQKIVFANALMELCDQLPGADVDEVTDTLVAGTRRITGPAYLFGGMGDGGGCHPRDNVAMAWLAREVDLSYDPFDAVSLAREAQTGYLVELVHEAVLTLKNRYPTDPLSEVPVVVCGLAYKPETNLTYGSPALLAMQLLAETGCVVRRYDPHVDGVALPPPLASVTPCVVLIGTRHPEWETFAFPPRSIVIDPWRYVPDREGIEVWRVGEGGRG